MTNNDDLPLLFFDEYLDNPIKNDLSKFYVGLEEEQYLIDKGNLIYEVFDSRIMDYTTISFESSIKSKLKKGLKSTKRNIELGFKNRFSDKQEVKAYADFLRIKVKAFMESDVVKEIPFLKTYLEELNVLINKFSQQNPQYSFIPSFNLIAESPEIQSEKVDKLFYLLTETPSLINCSRQDFKNAFSGNEVENKIQWLAISTRNKRPNQTSLLYLMDSLIDNDHLSSSIIHDLYKYMRYVFVNANGEELKNLKNTRQQISNKPDFKERIDDIISSM